MLNRNLLVLSFLVVALGYAAPANAERLSGSYRGPEDAKAADTSQDESEEETSNEVDSSGPEAGESGDDGGGLGSGSEGGSEGGSESSGEGLGGGGGGSEGESAGGASDSGDGGLSSSGGGSSGGGRPGGGGGASATEKFELVSWFFEHNREEFVYRVAAERNRRVKLPPYSSVGILSVLPEIERERSPVTPEDRERIFDILKSATIDKHSVVRDAAVIALGKLGTPKAVEVLLERRKLESSGDVQEDTLLALGMSRNKDATAALLETLGKKRNVQYALLGLGLSGDAELAGPAALEYFDSNIRRAKNDHALACAAIALGGLRYGDGVGSLTKALKSKKTPNIVKVYVVQALGRIGGDDAQKALIKALDGKDQQVRRASALALGEFIDSDVLKVLADKRGLKNNADPLMAGFAAVSMGSILDELAETEWKRYPEAIREVALATRKSKIKSQYANVALALFGGIDNETRRFYKEELGDTSMDPETMSALAMSVGLAGESSVESELVELASSMSRDPKLGSYAALAIGMIPGQAEDQAKALREIYRKVDRDDVRRGAIAAMGLVGDRKDVKFLIGILKAKEDSWLGGYTRGAAAMSLGLIRDGESVAKIQALLRSPDKRTRAFAVAALGFLADKDPSPVLSSLVGRNNFRAEFPAVKVVLSHL